MDMDNYNSQWVSFHIRDHLGEGKILVQNTIIEGGGEFYNVNDRRQSLTEEDVDELVIPPLGVGEISAHGRRGSEGRLDLFHGESKICELHWENRGGEFTNLVEVLDSDDKYKIVHGGWNPDKGPLGHVFVDIEKRNL
ncbi:hypothetical protein N7495_001046 [Penicillium taxi]|uniref:uncharacterized protein n=1 Tax=Penicillium taxi TaxID=168475 RepID=UPI002545A63C|nr:uncharacterized protein N7495_001046 [Penicillium taxi]KAJ5908364.1 hypothetical protein N7495_001046 [Penicillium taxi]